MIAGDELQLDAEHVAHERRIGVGVGAGAFAADREAQLQRVLPGLDRRRVPGRAQRNLVGAAAEPGELGRIELHPGGADQRLDREAAAEGAEHRAVFRGHVVDVVGGVQAAGAGEVLDDEVRVAGKVPAHVAAERARIEVIAAAGGVADDDGDVLALVELGHGLRLGAGRHRHGRRGPESNVGQSAHFRPPMHRFRPCNGRASPSTRRGLDARIWRWHEAI